MSKTTKGKRQLSKEEAENLINILQERFEKNPKRHKGIKWSEVLSKLEKSPEKLWSLNEMEKSGGEPDLVVLDENGKKEAYGFYDCSKESPKGRRSLCYDREALESRKKHKPENSVIEMAKEMGVELLTEEEYRKLQEFGEFDSKTSSWVQTPSKIRKLGGALFCDFRFDTVFLYHNGAESYYAARGFRACLKI